MRHVARVSGKRKSHRAQMAEELERRVMLSAAVAAFTTQSVGVGAQPWGVTLADVNRDRKLDLIATSGSGNFVQVQFGNGNGTFANPINLQTGTTPFSVAVGDFDRDGRPDLVTANNGSANVSVMQGEGGGSFNFQRTYGAGTQSRFMAVADVNGDGKPDLVVANYGAGTVSV